MAGVLLAAIPIVIHLLNRRRFKEQRWAAMEFLLRAMRKNRRRLKFEQWLLLAMRCLLLGMLGLALARPMGCGEGGVAGLLGRQGGVQVIVLDNSYSMSYEADRSDARTHLDQARRMALGLLDRMGRGSGDAVAVVTASSPARVVFPLGYDREAARAAVMAIEPTAVATDLAGAMKLAGEVARESAEPVKLLHVLSDGTRSSLREEDAGLKEAGREASGVFTRMSYYHLGLASQSQAAVLKLDPMTALVTARGAGGGTEMQATVEGFGAGETRALQWRLDGQVLPGGGEVQVGQTPAVESLPGVRFGRAGARVVSVTLGGQAGGGDRLPLDDTRLRVVDVVEKASVLIVEGERGGGPLGSSGAFLRLALSPPALSQALGDGGVATGATGVGGGRSNSPLEVEAISDLELPGKVLGEYRVLILAGVGQIPDGMAEQLRGFVQGGGVLVVFMGEAVEAESYNRTMLPRGLLPGPLVRRVTAPLNADSAPGSGKGYTMDFKPAGNLHPMLAAFRGETRSGLDTAQIFTYWEVAPGGAGNSAGTSSTTAPAAVERVLNYAETGAPAITLQRAGEGRVVFVSTSSGSDGWTTLPAKPVFVSLMQEMIGTTMTARDGWMNVVAGGRLLLPSGLTLAGVPELVDEAGRKFMLTNIAVGGGDSRMTWQSDVLTQPGVYTLTGLAGGGMPVVVNPDAGREADVRTVEDISVMRSLGEPANLDLYKDQLPAQRSMADERRADFGWFAMLVLLGLVGAESLLALKFGHHRKGGV